MIVFEKGLPANLDAERFVLGSILLDPGVYSLVAAAVAREDFSLEAHRRIHGRMGEILERGGKLDRVTLANELERHGQLDSVGGLGYLVSLDDGLPQLFNLDGYLRIVREKAILRRAIFEAQRLMDRCFDQSENTPEILDLAESAIRALSESAVEKKPLRSAADVIGTPEYFASHERAVGPQIRYPWGPVNAILTGLEPQKLIIIAARPGLGKSAAAGQIAYTAAKQGFGVALYSLEMSSREILERIACGVAGVDAFKFRQGYLDGLEHKRLTNTAREVSALPLYLDDSSGCTVAAIQAGVRRLRSETPVDLVLIDYLQLMESLRRHDNRCQEVTEISRGLKRMARELDMPVVVLAQLNREPEKQHRKPMLSDLRESGSIEQDADVVVFLHQPRNGNSEIQDLPPIIETEFLVAKHRGGPVGKVALGFHRRYTLFAVVERHAGYYQTAEGIPA